VDFNLVKQLREKTNAGMMDCKKALEEASGDIEKAVECLRKKGIATAAKKGHRKANEGIINSLIINDTKTGVLVEVNCETDFVSRNEEFKNLVTLVTEKILTLPSEELSKDKITANPELKEIITQGVIKIGENINIKRCVKFETSTGKIGSYIHMGGKIGVLIELENAPSDSAGLLKEIAMQIAATNPEYISREEVSAEILEKEKSIISAQITGKPENIMEKIIEGKIEKFYEESCLVDQVSVRDSKQKIKDILSTATIKRFERYQLGE
jgi:elongation factor Ts